MRRHPTSLILCLLISGCSLLAPVETHDRFFTLTSTPSVVPAPAGGPVVVYGLGPVTLPAYLDRNEIARRISSTEVEYVSGDRWAEPLATNVTSVLQQDLANLLGTARVIMFPWPQDAAVTYQVEVGISRFDVDTGGHAQLIARWAIKDSREKRYVMLRDSSLSHAGQANDTPAAVAALSTLLGELSAEIATALRTLPATAPGAR